jgi:hypothetical protein
MCIACKVTRYLLFVQRLASKIKTAILWLPGLVSRNALFWAITQSVVAIPYRRFGTT